MIDRQQESVKDLNPQSTAMQRRQQRKAQEIMSEIKQFKQITKHKAHEDAYLAQMTHATSLQRQFPAHSPPKIPNSAAPHWPESLRPSHRSGYEI
jgi:hypothetical protein